MKSIKSARWVVAIAALASCAFIVGPFTSSGSAGTVASVKTVLVAHSIVADINDHNLQANVPLRPSANLYARTESGKVPLAGQFVQFFASGHDLCAVKTNSNGYAECAGVVRLTWSTLALGKYLAVHPEQGIYAKSQDTGQILTIGSASILP